MQWHILRCRYFEWILWIPNDFTPHKYTQCGPLSRPYLCFFLSTQAPHVSNYHRLKLRCLCSLHETRFKYFIVTLKRMRPWLYLNWKQIFLSQSDNQHYLSPRSILHRLELSLAWSLKDLGLFHNLWELAPGIYRNIARSFMYLCPLALSLFEVTSTDLSVE